MAIDSRDKRFSMIGLSQPVPSVFANPDGTIGAQDRAQLLFLYAGIALGELVSNIVEGLEYTMPYKKAHYTMEHKRLHYTLGEQD